MLVTVYIENDKLYIEVQDIAGDTNYDCISRSELRAWLGLEDTNEKNS